MLQLDSNKYHSRIVNKDARVIATSNVYASLISNENMPKVTLNSLSSILNVAQSFISAIYKEYFMPLIKRIGFDFIQKYRAQFLAFELENGVCIAYDLN